MFLLFQSSEGRLRLICGDHYALTKEYLKGGADVVFDRGALVAIDPKDRPKYDGIIIKMHRLFTFFLVDMFLI
jgi:hypothetical protein